MRLIGRCEQPILLPFPERHVYNLSHCHPDRLVGLTIGAVKFANADMVGVYGIPDLILKPENS